MNESRKKRRRRRRFSSIKSNRGGEGKRYIYQLEQIVNDLISLKT
jgi:hypothetical protein